MQYLACGRPVLATPLPGLKEAVAGEGQGIVYAAAEDMGAAAVSLLKSAERRQKLGKAAEEYARRMHGYDTIVEQLEEILAGVVERGEKK